MGTDLCKTSAVDFCALGEKGEAGYSEDIHMTQLKFKEQSSGEARAQVPR